MLTPWNLSICKDIPIRTWPRYPIFLQQDTPIPHVMCILLVTTDHPTYPVILLNNRDEFLNRPTARAHWWDTPNAHVLGGRDLQRSIRGTWLGITRQGCLSVLTNFREEKEIADLIGLKSRGELPIAWLTSKPGVEESQEKFAERVINDKGFHGVGGFTLAYGTLRRTPDLRDVGRLAFVSNRTEEVDELQYSPRGTWGLSNSHFGDRGWPKVVNGEKLLERIVQENVQDGGSADELVEKCFNLLSTDSLPRRAVGEEWHVFTYQMRKSILVPPVVDEQVKEHEHADELAAADDAEVEVVKAVGGSYGTQKQTVILVDRAGKVKYVERTLYDERARRVTRSEQDVVFEFDIEGWDGTSEKSNGMHAGRDQEHQGFRTG